MSDWQKIHEDHPGQAADLIESCDATERCLVINGALMKCKTVAIGQAWLEASQAALSAALTHLGVELFVENDTFGTQQRVSFSHPVERVEYENDWLRDSCAVRANVKLADGRVSTALAALAPRPIH